MPGSNAPALTLAKLFRPGEHQIPSMPAQLRSPLRKSEDGAANRLMPAERSLGLFQVALATRSVDSANYPRK